MMKINETNFNSITINRIKENMILKVKNLLRANFIVNQEIESDIRIIYKPSFNVNLENFIEEIIGLEENFQNSHEKYYLNEYIICCNLLSESTKVTNSLGRKRYFEELLATAYMTDLSMLLPQLNDIRDINLQNEVSNNDENFKNYINNALFDRLITLNNALKKIFLYENTIYDFRDELLDAMKLDYCPYCNESLIYRISCTEELSIVDLDHFYKKSLFPLFTLSLGNFVPSCSTCNRNLKAQSNVNISNPRIEGFRNSAWFEVSFPANFIENNYDTEDIEIDIKIDDNQYFESFIKIKNSVNVFKIKSRYNHKDMKSTAKQLLKASKDMNSEHYLSYIRSVIELTNRQYTYEDLKSYVFDVSYDDEEAIDYRLGKFKKDIINQLTN